MDAEVTHAVLEAMQNSAEVKDAIVGSPKIRAVVRT
jgi:hypothetical protein